MAAAVFSLGIGILVALSKSKKHYIGLVWADGDSKGGMVLQADKNEFRGILAALEGLTGKRAIDTDLPEGHGKMTTAVTSEAAAVTPRPDQVLLSVHVESSPADAFVEVDGYPAGKTPGERPSW